MNQPLPKDVFGISCPANIDVLNKPRLLVRAELAFIVYERLREGKRNSICSSACPRHWSVWGVHFLSGSSVGARWVLSFLPTTRDD